MTFLSYFTPGQQAALFAAAPFLLLALVWAIGLAFTFPQQPAPKPIPVRIRPRDRRAK